MKFFGEPNMYVKIVQKGVKNKINSGIHFDENGVFETDNEDLIKRLKTQFRFEENREFENVQEPEIIETETEIIQEPEPKQEEVKPKKRRGKHV